MGYYIYSTLAAPQAYTTYVRNDVKELSIVEETILINGGAGVTEAKNLITPLGVMTEVSSDQLNKLNENSVFKMHVENGYIKIEEKEKKVESVVTDMNTKDKSRQLTPNEFEKSENGKPSKLKPGRA